MSAWGKVNGVKEGSKVMFMSDTKSFFSKNHGWAAGMGDRNGRWAMIIEKDGKVSYAENEKNPREVTVRDSPDDRVEEITDSVIGLRCGCHHLQALEACATITTLDMPVSDKNIDAHYLQV